MVDTSLMPVTKRFQFFSTCRDRRSLTTCGLQKAEAVLPGSLTLRARVTVVRVHKIYGEKLEARLMLSDAYQCWQLMQRLCQGHNHLYSLW